MVAVASSPAPRKSTLSVREFSHLVGKSLDVSHPANMSLLAHNTLFLDQDKGSPGKHRSSPLQRIFLRSSPVPPTASPQGCAEDTPATPRKIGFSWPFTRASPDKQRSTRDDPHGPDMSDALAKKSSDPADNSIMYRVGTAPSVVSFAAGSTSSLGSLIAPNEQFFFPVSRDDSFDDCDPTRISFRGTSTSPVTFASPPLRTAAQTPAPPRSSLQSADMSFSDAAYSESGEIGIALTSEDDVCESIETCPLFVTSDGTISEDDPTPRAATFNERGVAPGLPGVGHNFVLAQRRRQRALSLMIPLDTSDAPETETDTEPAPTSSSLLSPSLSCASTASFSGLALPHQEPPVPSTLTHVHMSVASGPCDSSPVKVPDIQRNSPSPRPRSSQGSLNSHHSAGVCARTGSKSTRSPPPSTPGPPPRCPLPAVPGSVTVPHASSGQPFSGSGLRAPVPLLPVSEPVLLSLQVSQFPPVPPLPPALKAKSSILLAQSSPPSSNSTLSAACAAIVKSQPHAQVPVLGQGRYSPSKSPSKLSCKSQGQMQPHSPPGTLRLPSRLPRNAGPPLDTLCTTPRSRMPRGSLPSPPESPTKGSSKRSGSLGGSPSKKAALGTQSPKLPSTLTLTPPTLRRPTSIGAGILEATSASSAAGNAAVGSESATNVRRTKSILLLGSRSKFAFAFGGGNGANSNHAGGCPGTQKRVQIRAESEGGHECGGKDDLDVRHSYFCAGVGIGSGDKGGKEGKDGNASTLKRDRRKSSLGLMNIGLSLGRDKDKERDREAQSAKRASDPTPGPTSTRAAASTITLSDTPAPQLLVLRERRHSAPLLSLSRARTRSRLTMDGNPEKDDTHVREPSLDWTLSLPFSTDAPGDKMFPSYATKEGPPTGEYECGDAGADEDEKEDWTLCMPLKVRVEVPPELPPIQDKGENGSDPEGEEGPDPSVQNSQPELAREHDPDSVYTQDSSRDQEQGLGCGAEDCRPDENAKHVDQLPTPSPSPTPSSPLSVPSPFVHVHVDSRGPETELELGVRRICESDGGLDIDSGRGKRGSGWNVFGWFNDDVPVSPISSSEWQCHSPATRDWACVSPTSSAAPRRRRKSSCHMRAHSAYGLRHPRQGSTGTLGTTETSETIYYSARSSWRTE